MRKIISVGAFAIVASIAAAGCGHSERTTVRRETVQTIPAPSVVERRTTVETVPAPISEEHTTRVREHTRSVETTE